jgi:hypothetical protein
VLRSFQLVLDWATLLVWLQTQVQIDDVCS